MTEVSSASIACTRPTVMKGDLVQKGNEQRIRGSEEQRRRGGEEEEEYYLWADKIVHAIMSHNAITTLPVFELESQFIKIACFQCFLQQHLWIHLHEHVSVNTNEYERYKVG